MIGTNTQEATPHEHEQAFSEVAFLLDIFTGTIDLIMGGATAPVGRIAGRDMARKIPVYLEDPSLTNVVAELATRMKGGFVFRLVETAGDPELVFDHCVIQEVCSRRKLELGGATCKLFHSYLDGQINELIARPVKSELVTCGTSCRACLRTQ